jgi:hypothetical protein
MDGGGEFGKCHNIHHTFAKFGYAMEPTSPDLSHQNRPGEQPHQTIGDTLLAMLMGANLATKLLARPMNLIIHFNLQLCPP